MFRINVFFFRREDEMRQGENHVGWIGVAVYNRGRRIFSCRARAYGPETPDGFVYVCNPSVTGSE